MSAVILASDGFEHNGFRNLVLVSRRRFKNPQYGLGYEYVYKGTPEAINSAFLSLADDQDAVVDEQGPIWTLTVRTPDDPTQASSSVYAATYELLGNSLQKDIREHRKALTLESTAALTRSKMDKIEKYLSQISTPPDTSTLDSQIGATTTNARKLYEYMRQRNGSAAYQVSQFVFRVTTIVSRRTSIQILYSNLNKLYSFAQLIDETDPPSGYVLSLTQIQEQCAPTSTIDDYEWSWLKQAPTLTVAAGNRLAIQNEYWLEEWSTFVYDSA